MIGYRSCSAREGTSCHDVCVCPVGLLSVAPHIIACSGVSAHVCWSSMCRMGQQRPCANQHGHAHSKMVQLPYMCSGGRSVKVHLIVD